MAPGGLLGFNVAQWRAQNVARTEDVSTAPSVIRALDTAKTSWYHVVVVIVAGMGFFCDAYDLFNVSIITNNIGRVHYPDIRYYSPTLCESLGYNSTAGSTCGTYYSRIIDQGISPADAINYVPSAMPANVNAAIKAVALVGTFCGQVIFGYLGDRFGRKPVYGFTLVLMIITSLGSGLSFGSSPTEVVATLCFFRFFLGVGVGGDYPLSATIMSEYSSRSNRGRFVSLVFAQQGTGLLVAGIVSLTVASIFMNAPGSADAMWRIVLMFGAVPTLATMYARLGVPETPRYTLYVRNDLSATNKDMAGVLHQDFGGNAPATPAPADPSAPAAKAAEPAAEPAQQAPPAASRTSGAPVTRLTTRQLLRKFGWQLFGCASTWFLLDVAFYSQNLFQADIFTTIGWIPAAYTMTAAGEVYAIARAQCLIALCSTIPGYYFTSAFIDKLGRFFIQIMGFFMMTVFMAALAGAYNTLVANSIEGFLALYSLGAITGAFGFAAAVSAVGLQETLGILVGVNFLGLLCTFFVPETKNRSLEEMSGDQAAASASGAVAVGTEAGDSVLLPVSSTETTALLKSA